MLRLQNYEVFVGAGKRRSKLVDSLTGKVDWKKTAQKIRYGADVSIDFRFHMKPICKMQALSQRGILFLSQPKRTEYQWNIAQTELCTYDWLPLTSRIISLHQLEKHSIIEKKLNEKRKLPDSLENLNWKTITVLFFSLKEKVTIAI